MSDPETQVVNFPIADIRIPEHRQRKEAKADAQLVASIESSGLINPIVIHSDGTLVAGERRLDAHRQLKRLTIRATIFETLTPIRAFLIELQENIARKALSWQEEAQAIFDYHKMRTELFAGWTVKGTANDVGLSDAHVYKVLAVAAVLSDEEVAGCQTFTGAYNLIIGRADRARAAAVSRGLMLNLGSIGNGLSLLPPSATKEERTEAILKQAAQSIDVEKVLGQEPDRGMAVLEAGALAAAALAEQRTSASELDGIILNADFLEWLDAYAGPQFDVLHIDFPYGKNYSGSRTRRTGRAHVAPVYADNPDIFFELLDGLLTGQERIAYPSAHCIFWFDMQYYQLTCDAFASAEWQLAQPFPLIWTKGYSGVAADPRRRPRHCYETALLFSRGDRRIVKLEKDHFECAVDEKLHINQKPIPMLKHFLSLVVDEHTAVLDPTCGSGSALAAARMLGSQRILGLELDLSNAEIARFVLDRQQKHGG